jgi:hypothetical protein
MRSIEMSGLSVMPNCMAGPFGAETLEKPPEELKGGSVA